MGGVEVEMDGGDSNGEDEGMEMVGAARGKVGVPEREVSQTSESRDAVGTTLMNGTLLVETEIVIIGNIKISECISGEKLDFQKVLREIDFELSKFDSPEMGLSKIGPMVVVDQTEGQSYHKGPSSTGLKLDRDEMHDSQGSPHDLKCNTRGWKRLVQDRALGETQPMQTQKK